MTINLTARQDADTLARAYPPGIVRAKELLAIAMQLVNDATWQNDAAEDRAQDVGCAIGQAIADLDGAARNEAEWMRDRGL
jgi:hypothetical protein